MNRLWLLWAWMIETFQLRPTQRRVQMMNKKHTSDMFELKLLHAHEIERAEANFNYRLERERSLANWLWRKVETIREFHGGESRERREFRLLSEKEQDSGISRIEHYQEA